MADDRPLSLLVDEARSLRATCRADRATAALTRHRMMAATPRTTRAVLPIVASNGRVCALDGDGTTVCSGDRSAEKLVGYDWSDVPPDQRCNICATAIPEFRDSSPWAARPVADGPAPAERAQRAFDHAVAAERRAIALHLKAALMHEGVAARLDLAAEAAAASSASEDRARRAAAERQLAIDATERAEAVRRRLSAEGVDLSSE